MLPQTETGLPDRESWWLGFVGLARRRVETGTLERVLEGDLRTYLRADFPICMLSGSQRPG